jgi:toxin ParE1/3/4
MRRATFLASVEADLVDIFTSIARGSGSLSIARRYVRRRRDYCHHLASLPGQMGRPRQGSGGAMPAWVILRG